MNTRIRFTLPETSETTLRIYDVMGRHVATLIEGRRTAGPHEVTWHAAEIASGVYFYELRQGTYRAVRSLILLK